MTNDTVAIAAVANEMYGSVFDAEHERVLEKMQRQIERAKRSPQAEVRSYARRAEVELIGRRATLRYSKGDYAGAVRDRVTAVDLSIELRDTGLTASAYLDLGFTFECIEEMERALDAYREAAAWAERGNDGDILGRVQARLGSVHMAMGRLDSADIYFNKATPLTAQEVQWVVLERQAQVRLLRGDTASALDLLDTGCAECQRQRVPQGSAYLLQAKARILAATGDPIAAMEAWHGCIALFDSLGWSDDLTSSLIERGEMQYRNSHYDRAEQDLMKALHLAEKRGDIASIAGATDGLQELYRRQGHMTQAFAMLQRHKEANDSIRDMGLERDLLKLDFKAEQRADSLLHAQQQQAAAFQLQRERTNRNLLLAGGILALIFGSISYRQRRRTQKALKRSDELLLNILPGEVADELKMKGEAQARHFDNATILFSDFKGFTQASEKMSPQELVEELNTCFKAFDHIIAARGIEKIKTIGDAYMAAGGLPDPASTSPADVVHAALEMQDFMKQHKAEREAAGKHFFEMRVGIHTGPVVAGIVGVKKFQYDIWGDTVNTASRMESSGEVGQVNISEATYRLVNGEERMANGTNPEAGIPHPPFTNSHSPAFVFTPRGKIQAKGKGEMEMYFVSARVPESG